MNYLMESSPDLILKINLIHWSLVVWSAGAGTLILILEANNRAVEIKATYFTQLVIMGAPCQDEQLIFRWWKRGGFMQIACNDDITGENQNFVFRGALALWLEQRAQAEKLNHFQTPDFQASFN